MKRENTRKIMVGNVQIGGQNKVVIQSMCNTKTKDIEATVKQILNLEKAGCEIIRVACLDIEDAKSIKEIKKQIHIPLLQLLYLSLLFVKILPLLLQLELNLFVFFHMLDTLLLLVNFCINCSLLEFLLLLLFLLLVHLKAKLLMCLLFLLLVVFQVLYLILLFH